MIGDFLYKLSPKDLNQLGIDLVRYNGTTSAAATSVLFSHEVPNDRVWVLQSVVWVATPGAAQNLLRLDITEGQNVGGAITQPINYLYGSSQPQLDGIAGYPAATVVIHTAEFEGLMVGSRKVLQMRASFDAGAAANSLTAYINGFSIPRGSIAF